MDESELTKPPNSTVPEHDGQEQLCSPNQSEDPQKSGDPPQADKLEQLSEAKRGDDEDSAMDHSNVETIETR